MPTTLILALALFAGGFGALPHGAEADVGRDLGFDQSIAPILVKHCLDCHSGSKPKGGLDLSSRARTFEGGESGPAIVAGRLEESPFWTRVFDNEMPPKGNLQDADKAKLRTWLEAGAPWGTDPIDPFQYTNDHRAGRDWWSLRPLGSGQSNSVSHNQTNPLEASRANNQTNPLGSPIENVGSKPAETSRENNQTNPMIDLEVDAKLKAAGLERSKEADRRTLIRRATFDLLGLPPTPEEVRAFVNDPDPDCYTKLVDRLLASPHYGERWGRHWLDVARFGESDGFERNLPRANSWPYRDWVIEAFNNDLPYDQFAQLQIAGDVIHPDDPEAAKATGFLVAGVHNTTLGNDLMRAIARQDELEDIVGTVSQTFLGLTVNCARCHDHKFDPIAQADYYRIASALSGVEHGERDLTIASLLAEQKRAETDLEATDRMLVAIEAPIDLQILTRHLNKPIDQLPPKPVASWNFQRETHQADPDRLVPEPLGGAKSTELGGRLDGKAAYYKTPRIDLAFKAKTLEAWVKLSDLNQQGGGVVSIVRADGSGFDSIVFGEIEPGRWMAGSEGFARTQSFQGEIEREAKDRLVQLAIVYQGDGTVTGYRDGQPYGKPYKTAQPIDYPAGEAFLLFGCRHEPAGGNRMLSGTIAEARIYDRTLSSAEVAASTTTRGISVSDRDREALLDPANLAEWTRLKGIRKRLAEQLVSLKKRAHFKAYATISGAPGPTRLLVRGQLNEPAEVIAPGGVLALGDSSKFGLEADAPERERRLKLARWITSKANPLFARVMVNRVWHHHFGLGIVETPNDFGFNGGRPSHPELLDQLSRRFIANGYKIKTLHREIMTSKTYRQASTRRENAIAIDADNRLLWRKSPRRLEAEAVRDALLSAAGLLNLDRGGKGFSDYRDTFLNGTTYYEPIDPVGPEFQRRSVYRFVPRGANQGLLDTFDCPDPSATAPRRSLTTTPIQALALWNDRFVIRMAEALGQRLAAEIPGDQGDPQVLDQRIERLWQIAYQRELEARERDPARAIVNTFGFRALGRAVFNSNEFLTVE